MMALLQGDDEVGEILMRAFILRRVELVAAGVGDVVLIGSANSAGTFRIKEFLMRNGHPYHYIDLERDPDVQNLLDNFHVLASEIPVVICQGKLVLRNPSNRQIADCLGFNEPIDQTQVRDLVIIGAGPSGLAAAVYGASEGLDVLVLETARPEARPAQAVKSKTTWGSQPASRARSLHSRVQPGAKVRSGDAHHQGHATHLRPQAIRGRGREWGPNSGPNRHNCDRGREYRKASMQEPAAL